MDILGAQAKNTLSWTNCITRVFIDDYCLGNNASDARLDFEFARHSLDRLLRQSVGEFSIRPPKQLRSLDRSTPRTDGQQAEEDQQVNQEMKVWDATLLDGLEDL